MGAFKNQIRGKRIEKARRRGGNGESRAGEFLPFPRPCSLLYLMKRRGLENLEIRAVPA